MKVPQLIIESYGHFVVFIQKFIIRFFSFSIATCNLNKNPTRILLFRTCALGDFLFSIPALSQLRARYPNARIHLLTSVSAHKKLQNAATTYAGSNSMPWIDLACPSLVDEVTLIFSFNLFSLWFNIRPILQKFQPNVTVLLLHSGVDASSVIKKIFLLRILGVTGSILGGTETLSHRFLRAWSFRSKTLEHQVLGPLRSIQSLIGTTKLHINKIHFPLDLGVNARSWANNIWSKQLFIEHKIIAIAIGSIQPHKRWPIENFIELGRQLCSDHNVFIILIGSNNDITLSNQFMTSLDNARILNLVGKTSIAQLAALLERCSLLVGNDGGAMHLGSAMYCPVVSIISGIEYPGSIEPWNSPDLVVRHKVPCSPCYTFDHCPLGHNKCLVDIPVSAVFNRCRIVLSKCDSHP